VALSRREQRALREIEELLTADDPALAGLLSRAGAARWETIRRVTRAVVAVAVPLLLFGLLIGDMSFVGGGLLMLALLLLARWLGRRAEGAE
jgi:hypothetical protein